MASTPTQRGSYYLRYLALKLLSLLEKNIFDKPVCFFRRETKKCYKNIRKNKIQKKRERKNVSKKCVAGKNKKKYKEKNRKKHFIRSDLLCLSNRAQEKRIRKALAGVRWTNLQETGIVLQDDAANEGCDSSMRFMFPL